MEVKNVIKPTVAGIILFGTEMALRRLFPISSRIDYITVEGREWVPHPEKRYSQCYEFEGEPQLLKPHECEGWYWYLWDELPMPLFLPLASLIKSLGIEKLKEMTESKTCILSNQD